MQALKPLAALLQPGERFSVTGRAAYLHCKGGLLESKAGKAILGSAGRGVTTRNWATVLKLAALMGDRETQTEYHRDLISPVPSMRKEYDFSKARKNPYAARLRKKKPIRIAKAKTRKTLP